MPRLEAAQPARRRVYPGRLAELQAAYRAGRRPSPGADTRPAMRRPAAASVFGCEWLVFEIVADDAGASLDIRAAPIAAKTLRDALMSGYGEVGLTVPEWVSGHDADGAPTREAHLAVVPLSFAGFAHADGSLLGFALVPPADRGNLLADAGVVAALRSLTTGDGNQRGLWLRLGRETALRLRLTAETDMASLNPARYCDSADTWASVTPIVLDRHVKGTPDERAQQAITLVEEACLRIGLPRPTVRLSKHAALRGAVSAAPSGRAPSWTRWRLPPHVAGRGLTHAILQFPHPVPGPVLLGAGRFCGLGLCLPAGPA
jgi:CRISPR-associated protein Csb2